MFQRRSTQGPFRVKNLLRFRAKEGPVSGFAKDDFIIHRGGNQYLLAEVKGVSEERLTVRLFGSFFTTTGSPSRPKFKRIKGGMIDPFSTDIRAAVGCGDVGFEPPLDDNQWGEASVDLRLGFQFTKLKEAKGLTLSVADGLSTIGKLGLWQTKELSHQDAFGKRDFCNWGRENLYSPSLEKPFEFRSI